MDFDAVTNQVVLQLRNAEQSKAIDIYYVSADTPSNWTHRTSIAIVRLFQTDRVTKCVGNMLMMYKLPSKFKN